MQAGMAGRATQIGTMYPYRDREGADARWLYGGQALAREAPSVTDHVGVLGIRSLALAVRIVVLV
jgi:hypothetical protein